MKTAAAFTKGLLELESQWLTPIIASLVTIEDKNRLMLDRGGNFEVKEDMDRCKVLLNKIQMDVEMNNEIIDKISPDCPVPVKNSLLNLKNPWQALTRVHQLIGELCSQLKVLCDECEEFEEDSSQLQLIPQHFNNSFLNSGAHPSTPNSNLNFNTNNNNTTNNSNSNPFYGNSANASVDETSSNFVYDNDVNDCNQLFTLYHGETFSLMLDRWEKLNKDFLMKKENLFDLSKVPDVYDMIRYDILHNSRLQLNGMEELFKLSAALENSIVPQEYGSDRVNKRYIGSKICGILLEKIKYDLSVSQSTDMQYTLDHTHGDYLRINSLSRNVRTRLYFTSESHLHTLLNVLRYPINNGENSIISAEGLKALDSITELSYLTQIVIRLYENKSSEPVSYRCELSFTPGATNDPLKDKSCMLAPYVVLNEKIKLNDLIQCLDEAIDISNSTKVEDTNSKKNKELFGDETVVDSTTTIDVSKNDMHDSSKEVDTSSIKTDVTTDSIIPSFNLLGMKATFTHGFEGASQHDNTPRALSAPSSFFVKQHKDTNTTVNIDDIGSTSDKWERANMSTMFKHASKYKSHGMKSNKIPMTSNKAFEQNLNKRKMKSGNTNSINVGGNGATMGLYDSVSAITSLTNDSLKNTTERFTSCSTLPSSITSTITNSNATSMNGKVSTNVLQIIPEEKQSQVDHQSSKSESFSIVEDCVVNNNNNVSNDDNNDSVRSFNDDTIANLNLIASRDDGDENNIVVVQDVDNGKVNREEFFENSENY
jgi:hypothetical protein